MKIPIIAELGINHNGDIYLVKKNISCCFESRCSFY